MMCNPYKCLVEIDELNPDDSIVDSAYISEDKFLLILLLVSNGDVQTYYEVGNEKARQHVVNIRSMCGRVVEPVTISISPDASFVVVGLYDGEILVIPMKMILNVSWSSANSSPIAQSPFIIEVDSKSDPLMRIPTSVTCFDTKYPRRTTVVMTNKGGSIYLIDVEFRKCVAELTSPQSIHRVEIFTDTEDTQLLVTGFTGAQWVIPLENEGRGFAEVLATSIPSEFKQVDPPTTQLSINPNGVCALSSAQESVELYSSLNGVGGIPKKKYKVPPETWLTHFTDNVLFTVSRETDLRCAIHFGLSSVRLEYSLIREVPEWRILSVIPVMNRKGRLPECMIVNERGLARVEQHADNSLDTVASEFLFRLPVFSLITVSQVAGACGLESKVLKSRLVPSILSVKKEKKFSIVDLSRILTMAKAVELSMEKLLELFSATGREDNLLPELLRTVESDAKSPLRSRVVGLYAKKCENAREREDYAAYRHKKDGELSVFLTRHPDVVEGITVAVCVPLWKSSIILAGRIPDGATTVLSHLIEKGELLWKEADSTTRATMLSCVCQLDWSALSEKAVHQLVLLLCNWQQEFTAPVYHENCLRIAGSYADKFPEPCSILYLVSVLHLLSYNNNNQLSCSSSWYRSSACGLNSSVVISHDDRLIVWGDMTNQPARKLEPVEVPLKSARRGNSTDSPTASPSTKRNTKTAELPHPLHIDGRPHAVACGTEHMLILTTAGQLFSFGHNRFGQCGLGHAKPVAEPQLLEGVWPNVVKLSVGQHHSAILCEDGSVWTWGWGLYGQLGHGPRCNRDAHVPTRVGGLRDEIVSISCGRVHTLLLTDKGHILMAGGGAYGQTGLCEDIRKVHTFTRLLIGGDPNLKFSLISTHFYHSCAYSVCGRLFEWGRNPQEVKMKMFVMRRLRNAQKTNEDTGLPPTPILPAEVPREDLGWREVEHLLDGKVRELSTGLSHSALITDEGSMFTWGKSLEYQLGHGAKSERSEPHQVFEPAGLRWKHVVCGGNHNIAISEDGRVFGWGRNDFTQCGMPSDKGVSSPKKYFYQGKEGAKRCVQLPDDSVFVVRPTLVMDIQARLPQPGDTGSTIDESVILERIRKMDLATLQTVSRHFVSIPNLAPPLCQSVPLALCHLMAGNISQAIDQIGRAVKQEGQSDPVMAVSSIAWEVVANQEETQTKSLLQKAFGTLPMSATQRNSSQLKHLWPNVWAEPSCQKDLTPIDKIGMLEAWRPTVKPVNSVELSGASLRGNVARVRVWAQCSHVEHASVGVATECSTCADEWKERVKSTLGV